MNIWTIAPLVSWLTYLGLCFVAIQAVGKTTNRRANRIFVFYLAVAAIWSFTSFMMHLDAPPEQTLLWNQLLTIALVWTLITYYHFARAYANKKGGFGLYIGYALLIVLSILILNGYIVEYSYVRDGILYHSLGASIYFIGAFSLAYVGMVIFTLSKKHQQSADPIERNRTMYLITGWSILVALTYTNLIPAVAGLPLDHIGNAVNAALIAYAISRFNLLDLKLVVRRGLTYFSLIIALISVYISAVFLGHNILSTRPAISSIMLATATALLITLMARPLRRVIQEGIDRLFYRETYSYRRALLSFRNKMGNILDLDELAKEILPTLTKALHITNARLLFQDTVSHDFVTQFAYPEIDNNSESELKLRVDNPIVGWLDKKGRCFSLQQIDIIPEFRGLWQSEKEELARTNLELLCPITSRGKLIGILALGKKTQDSPLSHDDVELVRNMASQAGVIIENAQLYTQATLQANTDWLTGIYNHRSFHEQIDQEIARSSRFSAVFSIIMIDLDLFKTYNDTYGHLAGDEILRNIGKTITSCIRSVDSAFRYGGEEFAIILPETRLDDAYIVAERIRKAIETKTSPRAIPITASFGIANWPLDGVMKEEIIASADAALYLAKHKGRNQTCLSTDVAKPESSIIKKELAGRSRSLSIIYALAATVDAKDHYTYGHSKKVSDYAVILAEELNLSQSRIATMRAAGLLHDIGKVGIPDSILNKKEPLNDEEWQPIKNHPKLGVEILRHVVELESCLPAILHHHERYEGGGYPSGLKGDSIPLEARILCIADAYDAITSPRPYRQRLTPQEGLEELERCAGTQFDPGLVTVFNKIMQPTVANSVELKY